MCSTTFFPLILFAKLFYTFVTRPYLWRPYISRLIQLNPKKQRGAVFDIVWGCFFFIFHLAFIYRTVSGTGTGTDQNFIIRCRYFFEKAQAVSNYRYDPKFYYSLTVFFLLLSFYYVWHFNHMSSLPYLSRGGLMFFYFMCVLP